MSGVGGGLTLKSPPTKNFRSNSILAVAQPDKVRICLNVSLPKNQSLNDNIGKYKLEKVIMTSAKLFSYSIIEAGSGCEIWKFDFEDAYKNVPAKINELRYQGFNWLGKYFAELKQIFGSASSVQNFDVVSNTLKSLCASSCNLPSRWIHRQLDDTPFVCPPNKPWGREFAAKYKKLCSECNFKLAPDCPNKEKAFSKSTFGKVLGIEFDTTNLSWRLPAAKATKYVNIISNILLIKSVSLSDMQTLMGCLNHVAQMCPFMNNFRYHLNKLLATLINDSSPKLLLNIESTNDLRVWLNFLQDQSNWIPICHPVDHPPLCTKIFYSDAAGFPKQATWKSNIGCGVVGLDEKNDTCLAFQLWWPKDFITTKTDNKGSRFGDKTATLEQIGILIPLLLIPKKLTNQHIVFKTDNLACVFGHSNKGMKNDACASILIKSVQLICAFLGSVAHIVHVPRRSDWASEMADNLSRESTTGFLETQMLNRHPGLPTPEPLREWLCNPTEDWDLPFKLLKYVSNK
jgi:hypothetical protein